MKNKKSIILTLIIALCLALFTLSGCIITKGSGSGAISIVSIEKTESVGLKDIYTITYSDGSTYNFEITNGKDGLDGEDGKDGQEFDIDDFYNKYLETHPGATYEEFLKDVLNINATSNTASISKALQSSAKIYTEFTENYKTGFNSVAKQTSIQIASAVVYKVDANFTYFITNYHVVYNSSALEQSKIAKKIVCYLYGSEGLPYATSNKDNNGCTIYDYGTYAIECEYVGGSITADIAVVKAPTSSVLAVNKNVQPISFAKDYHVGDTAIAIGNPEGEGISVTQGVVSVDNENIYLAIDGTSRQYRSIRIDTSIYNGSSGGGLFDVNGNLIGITNAGDGTDQNVNYAIPLNIVKNSVENIMHYGGNAKKITLGIEVTSSNSKYVYNAESGYGDIVETITIAKVTDGSISEKAGLCVNDDILAIIINNVEYKINRAFNIGDLLLTVRSGDVISFKVWRNNASQTTYTYTINKNDLTQIA